MTTATGDIAVDFSGLADVDPYVDARFTYQTAGRAKILNGTLRNSTPAEITYMRWTDSIPTDDIISAKFEVAFEDTVTGTEVGVTLYDASRNGYRFFINATSGYLSEVNAGSGTDIGGGVITLSYVAGDVITLEYQKSTGRVEVFVNAFSEFSVTNTAHATKDLSAGIFLQKKTSPTYGITSFAGDGYSVAATAPTLTTVPATAYDGQILNITGTNLTGATADFGGEAATVSVVSDTEINVTIAQGGLEFATHTLTVTTSGGSATSDIELIVEPGTGDYINVVDPNTTDTTAFAYQVEDSLSNPVVTDDQFQWRYTGLAGDVTAMTVGADTRPTSLDQEGNVDGRFWDATDSTWSAWYTFTAAVPATVVPQFAPVIGTITKDANSASIPFTYPGSDATSFQGSTDGVNWVTVTSPISRTGLSAGTPYSGQVRAVNAAGTGTATTYNFTTESLPMPSITLVGSTVYLDVGEAYVEPGFSASDPVDGNITGSVTTSTDLNNSTAGTYSKTYSVTNSNGVTVSETRIIIVSVAGDDWPFSPNINYAAPKTWTWGNRHPKTNRRVRIFK